MKRWHDVFDKYRFPILILAVATAGLSQGMTLPLLSILLEQQGVSATENGWNAAAMYIGMMGASILVEKPIRKYGYKPIIVVGFFAVLSTSLLIPLWRSLEWWFFLRFVMGIGESSLHCATQMWISADSAPNNRGKRISLYGFAYGAGFSIGPLGVNLLTFGIWLPFLIVGIFYSISLLLIYFLDNRFPDSPERGEKVSYRKTITYGWYALLPALLYGYLESVLNSNVPIYILRRGIHESWVSIILFSFSAGALLTQMPLGILSDRIGRKKILMISGAIGAVGFWAAPLWGNYPLMLSVWLGVTGMVVGSFFSLGLAFLTDILPKHLMPTGNILASVLYSLGSMTGPGLTGMAMQRIHPASAFYFLGLLFSIFFLTGLLFKQSIKLKLSRDSS